MDRHMEDKIQVDDNRIAIENKIIDERNDNQLNKVIVVSLKLILIGLSAVYMAYEGIQLIKLYHNYDTIVSVVYQRPDSDQAIPSLTLCLPTIIDKNRLLAKYPDLKQRLNDSQTEDKRQNILTEYLDKALESGDWTQLTIEEEQAVNCSVNHWFIKFDSYSIPTDKRIGRLNCREVVKPIESYSNAKTKCFTYFSRLSSDMAFVGEYSMRDGVKNLNDLFEVIFVEFDLDFERYLSLSFIQNETTIAIHHQNMIASPEADAQHIEAGHEYEITINKIITKLMERPYSQCFDYRKRKDGIGSRKQCIDSCVLDLYKDKCDCIPIHLTNTLTLLNSSSHMVCTEKEMTFRSNRCYEDIAQEVGLCMTSERCPQDCQTIRYRYRTKTKRSITSCAEMSSSNATDICSKKVLIRIRLDESRDDEVVVHIPLITSGQLLAYISALIALFSGLSIIGFSNSLIAKLSTIRHISRPQVSDGSDKDIPCDQQIKQRTKQWFREKSRCIDQSEITVDPIRSSQIDRQMRTAIKRPLTSSVFDSHVKTSPLEVKSYDI